MIQVSRGDRGRSLRFFDAVGNASTRLRFRRSPTCRDGDPDRFPVPVETVREIDARTVTIDRVPSITLRDRRGSVLKTTHSPATTISRRGRSFVEVCTPVKLYLGVDGFVEIRTGQRRTTLDFGERRTVQVGARILYDRPDLAVTTTESVDDVFAAVSAFGTIDLPSGPERSFQTYRPHPPVIEFGSALEVPDALSGTSSGLQLSLPGTYFHAAVGAPLAYYLGADLEPGHPPGIHLDGETLLTWPADADLDRECDRLLQRVFFLDCLARQVTGYDVTLRGKTALADRLGVSWADVATLGPGERLRRYLALPMDAIDAHLPAWSDRAYVVPNRTTIETLPYLAYDLVPVYRAGRVGGANREAEGRRQQLPAVASEGRIRTASGLDQLASAATLTLGTTRPVGTDEVALAALRNRSRRNEQSDTVAITVVCNDPRMLPEGDSVESIYGTFATPSVSVRRHRELAVDELRDVLARPTDYLHYIGHILDDGLRCRDGSLSVDTLSEVGAEVFFLNACRSRREGRAMIERGAVGGIATRRPIANQGAIAVGRTIAELLIRGYPLGVALAIAQERHAVCRDYAVVGDPRIEIADTESGLPYLCDVRETDGGYQVDLRTVLTSSVRKGSLGSFHLGDDDSYDLNPMARSYRVGPEPLARFLQAERVPVRWQGEWAWSDDIATELAAQT